MMFLVLGKQSFVSKKGTQCNILHVGFKDQNVEGTAVKQEFVSDALFNKVQLNKSYSVVYNAYSNGRAYIEDLIEVTSNA